MSTDDNGIDYWNAFLASVAAWIGVVVSVALGCWRWLLLGISRGALLWRGVLLASHVADRWGDESGKKFREEIESLQDSIKELRIRVGCTEAKLGLGTFTTDAQGSLVFANHHAIAMLGRDSLNILGRHWITAIDDESRERVASIMRLACCERIPAHCSVVVMDTGKRLRLDIRPAVTEGDEVRWLSCELSEPK